MSNWEFALAIDVGNSRVVSGVARVTRGVQEEATVFAFGDGEHSAVSAVFVDSDGTMSFGSEAERLGAEDPARLVREFVHRIGDDVPIMIGEHAVRAEDLHARVCAWILEAATASEGFAPSVIAITHPTAWGGHRRGLVAAALQRVGITDAILLSEAESAARHYESSHPLETGRLLAVYDLGGTKFDALVLRKRAVDGVGCQPVGEQVSVDDLGGTNFDELLFQQVMTTTESASGDDHDDAMLFALTQLQREVTKAKETLSSEADATVPMVFPSNTATVRINRSEFEALIDASLERTLDALDLAIESAGIESNRLEAILLTGGSSRIPLVAQRLSERFNLPLVADNDPKATVALGAVYVALDRLEAGPSSGTALVAIEDASESDSDAVLAASRGGVLTILRPESGKSWWPKSPILLTTAAAFIAFAIVFSNTTAAGARWPDYIQAITDGAATVVAPLIPAEPTSPLPPSDRDTASSTRTEGTSDRGPSERTASRERTLTSEDPADMPLAGNRGTVEPVSATDESTRGNSAPKPPAPTSGPKAEPSSPPVAPPPSETAADASSSTGTTPPAGNTAPESDTPPTPPANPTPTDSAPPSETPPPTDATPASESTAPADPTPPAASPVAPPATEPAAVEPTPTATGGPTPEPTP